MYGGKKWIFFLLAMVLLFALCGCSGETDESPSTAEEVAISASFQQEGGDTLCGDTVRFSYGGNSAERSLDEDGKIRITGLPRNGDLELTILDGQERARGDMMLSLSEGAIIDATTDNSGVGHVTVRRDMDEVALVFTLRDDGTLHCSLWLFSADPGQP